jgi:hypothetical protein
MHSQFILKHLFASEIWVCMVRTRSINVLTHPVSQYFDDTSSLYPLQDLILPDTSLSHPLMVYYRFPPTCSTASDGDDGASE